MPDEDPIKKNKSPRSSTSVNVVVHMLPRLSFLLSSRVMMYNVFEPGEKQLVRQIPVFAQHIDVCHCAIYASMHVIALYMFVHVGFRHDLAF